MSRIVKKHKMIWRVLKRNTIAHAASHAHRRYYEGCKYHATLDRAFRVLVWARPLLPHPHAFLLESWGRCGPSWGRWWGTLGNLSSGQPPGTWLQLSTTSVPPWGGGGERKSQKKVLEGWKNWRLKREWGVQRQNKLLETQNVWILSYLGNLVLLSYSYLTVWQRVTTFSSPMTSWVSFVTRPRVTTLLSSSSCVWWRIHCHTWTQNTTQTSHEMDPGLSRFCNGKCGTGWPKLKWTYLGSGDFCSCRILHLSPVEEVTFA